MLSKYYQESPKGNHHLPYLPKALKPNPYTVLLLNLCIHHHKYTGTELFFFICHSCVIYYFVFLFLFFYFIHLKIMIFQSMEICILVIVCTLNDCLLVWCKVLLTRLLFTVVQKWEVTIILSLFVCVWCSWYNENINNNNLGNYIAHIS